MQTPQTKSNRLSIGDAADYLGVSIDTLRRWEKKEKIKALRSPGGHRYFDKSDLDKLFGTKYERVEETTRPNVSDKFKQIEVVEESDPTPPIDTPASPNIETVPTYRGFEPVKNLETPQVPPQELPSYVELPLHQPTPHEQEPVINQNVAAPEQNTPQTKLSSEQEKRLSEIIKDTKKDRNYSNLIHIIFAGLIIFGIIDIVIAYIWFTQSSMVTPIP